MAALAFALSPNHIRESHFALTDVPVTFFVAASLVLSLRAMETGRAIWLVSAAAVVGLAAATKYNGAYALVLPVIAAAAMGGNIGRRAGYGVAAMAVSVVAFLLAAPYTVLDLPGFLNAFGALSRFYSARPFADGASIYIGHMRVAVGWVGLGVIVVGIVSMTVRAWQQRDWAKWAMFAVLPFLYFYSVSTKQLIFARYLLPVLPFIFIFMAAGIVEMLGPLRLLNQPVWTRRLAACAVCAIALFPVARAAVTWPRDYGRRTTHDIAYEQIQTVIPAGSGVVIERSVLRLPRPYKILNVPWLGVHSPENYIARGMTFAVASSDAFGRIMANPAEHANEYEHYERIFKAPGHCLPPIQPTDSVSGPQIVVCRLDAAIQ
jgi:4-amino-4-deoxy-L-arabinose transferase-like glycosyltransferase